VLRIVVREEFSKDMVDVLLVDMAKAVEHFEAKQHVTMARINRINGVSMGQTLSN
jgi:hypothetical protein